MQKIRGCAGVRKIAMAEGDTQNVTVIDAGPLVHLRLSNGTFPAGLTPEEARYIAQALVAAAVRAEGRACANPAASGRAGGQSSGASQQAMIRLAVALLLLALPAEARWYAVDGDSLVETVTGEKVRVMGVDSPELKARCQAELDLALAAKRFTAAALERGPVTITRTRLDKYGRTLAVVRIAGEDLARLLIGAGLGRPYAGGRREGWC